MRLWQMLAAQQVAGIPSDYLSYWTMGNISGSTVIDESGIYDGTINGSVTEVSGQVGNCLDFAGTTSDYVLIGDNLTDFRATQCTICALVNADDLTGNPYIFDNQVNGTTGDRGGVAMDIFGNKLRAFFYAANGSSYVAEMSASPSTGTWYHMIAVFDVDEVNLYINNTLNDSASSGGSSIRYPANNTWTVMGQLKYDANQYNPLNGKLDEVYFYDRVLTSGERAAIFNATGL